MNRLRARDIVAELVVLAAALLCGPVLSAPRSNAADDGPQRPAPGSIEAPSELVTGLTQAIREEESRNGPYSEALIDELTSLGVLYQRAGEHDRAVGALDRALQIERVNDGLYTLDQAPLIRRLIVSERATGDVRSVADLQSTLLRLARLNDDDLRSVDIFRDAAEEQLEVYQAYLNGEFPPEINVSLGPFSEQSDDFSNRSLAGASLRRARSNLVEAIGILTDKKLFGSEQLQDLELQLIRSYYLQATADDDLYPEYREALYRLGRDSYRRLAGYSAKSGTAMDVARRLVELGDWHLLFSHNSTAWRLYGQARELLARQHVSPASIDEILSPDGAPVVLPTFLPSPLAAPDQAPASRAHVDVRFELTRYGRSRHVEALGASANVTDAAKERLVREIAQTRFRPRFADDGTALTSELYSRYRVKE